MRRAAVFGALGAVSGGIALVRTGGYALDGAQAARLTVLAPWQYVVVQHVARRIVASDASAAAHSSDTPVDTPSFAPPSAAVGAMPTPDDANVAGFLDGYLARMRPSLRRDLLRMLGLVEHLAPLASGYAHRFTALPPAAQDGVLRSLEASRSDLLRAGFDGLKSLVMMGYWRDPRTWAAIGYPGPLLGRERVEPE